MLRIPILDGWRALSILLVLAGHLLPLGPSVLGFNEVAAATGMAIFFTLSGFLITSMLLAEQDARRFLIRRLSRILPLAWAAMLILILINRPNASVALANLLFISNLPPSPLMNGGHHLWSLCVEVQFYALVALMVGIGGKQALYLLPILAVTVTGLRIEAQEPISIVTWHRVDEILAGASLSLFRHHFPSLRFNRYAVVAIAPIAFLSAYHTPLAYARPYLVATMVGVSIYASPTVMLRIFTSKVVVWVAQISYGLYVVHGMLMDSWLGSGSRLVKYAKRPILLAVTIVLAHLSFKYYERPMQRLGRSDERQP